MEEYITRGEYDADRKRLEAEDNRENKRIEKLEDSFTQMGDLVRSVDRLATNMDNMLKEQTKQGQRLEALESRDGEMWRKVVSYAVTAVVGVLVGFILKQLGIF